jgi:hypothetical protein
MFSSISSFEKAARFFVYETVYQRFFDNLSHDCPDRTEDGVASGQRQNRDAEGSLDRDEACESLEGEGDGESLDNGGAISPTELRTTENPTRNIVRLNFERPNFERLNLPRHNLERHNLERPNFKRHNFEKDPTYM